MKTSIHQLNLNGKIATATVDLFPKYSRIVIQNDKQFQCKDQAALNGWLTGLISTVPVELPLLIRSKAGLTLSTNCGYGLISVEEFAEIERSLG